MVDEQIWEVDANDQPIGSISRAESRKTGARYRIVRVLVEDEDGNILLQKRSSTKKSYPGCWDTSAGGNISYGESYLEAALRELEEEIGIKDVSLSEVYYGYSEAIDPKGRKMNRFTKIYRTIVPSNTVFSLNDGEAESVKWLKVADIKTIIESNKATDGLRLTYDKYYCTQK